MQLGQHSLYFASFDGDLSVVRLLIQRRANIDLPMDVSKLNLSIRAVSHYDAHRMIMASLPLVLLVKRDI